MSRLSTIYTTLVELADRTGNDQRADLQGGAHLAVRVQDGITTVAISRPGKRLGDTEIVTFKSHFQIPTEATRWPSEGQKEIKRGEHTSYTIAWSWRAVQEEA